jgi:hypothetical protein
MGTVDAVLSLIDCGSGVHSPYGYGGWTEPDTGVARDIGDTGLSDKPDVPVSPQFTTPAT